MTPPSRAFQAVTLLVLLVFGHVLFLQRNDPEAQQTTKNATTTILDTEFVPTDTAVDGFTNIQNLVMDCPATHHVRIHVSRPQDGEWTLQSLTVDGRAKTVGGDEYYITYTDDSMTSPTAVAFVHDNHDGTYRLDFCTSPSLRTTTNNLANSTGTLRIVLQYSCGMGHFDPPAKKYWNTSGAMNAVFLIRQVSAPPMSVFVAPSSSHVNLANYTRVVAVGDSTMRQFCKGRSSKLVWQDHVGGPLNLDTVNKSFPKPNGKMIPSFLDKIRTELAAAQEDVGNDTNNIALLLTSGVWDILDHSVDVAFEHHGAALRLMLSTLKREFPSLPIYWKSITALHIHVVDMDMNAKFLVERVKYMSNSRTRQLYLLQNKIMEEFNVPVLDLYPATYLSANRMLLGDGRHYTEEFNHQMLEWFYHE